MTKKARWWGCDPWTCKGTRPRLGISWWVSDNDEASPGVSLLSQSSLFTKNPRNLVLELLADECVWEVTSHHLQARLQQQDSNGSQDGELGTGPGSASHTHLVFTARVSTSPQEHLPILAATFSLEHLALLLSGVSQWLSLQLTVPPHKWPRAEFFFFFNSEMFWAELCPLSPS